MKDREEEYQDSLRAEEKKERKIHARARGQMLVK
jgi:hypothetical protein